MRYDVLVWDDQEGWQTVRVAVSLTEAEGIEDRLSPRRVSISATGWTRPTGVSRDEWAELIAEKNAKLGVL